MMSDTQFLYQKLDNFSEMWWLDKTIPLFLSTNINQRFEVREYQKEAFARFFYYYQQYPNKEYPIHLMYNMATGSGKTFVMAGLILYLYEQWYRNFLFFVNSNNIIEKTKANFLNSNSSKYLFNQKVIIDNQITNIREVSNFATQDSDDICIKFTTIQWLHSDLNTPKENSVTFEDFEDKKIVMISDEAHHINADTKKWKMTKDEQEEKQSWEYTVMKILNTHRDNIMLEFTATVDLQNEFIHQKYLNKIIYKYDLKQFRLDRYSKEVDILKSDMDKKERIIQALILSQYRLKIAEKYKIYCKPVILFKSQKTIAESEANKEYFIELIKNLSVQDIQSIQPYATGTVLQSAFEFFENNSISDWDLVRELQQDFAPECVVSANDDKEASKNQILLNTLEDKDNRIRAVFAVQKLNEWWDVLNLFDIVRLYESRSNVVDKKTWKIKVWPQTISEAQLIGRWARYFPFETDETLWEDAFKRKFDNKDHELKVLETFYYHTGFDNLYITEIKQALREIGVLNEKEQKKITLRLKESFVNNAFYKEWLLYTNTRIEKWWQWINSLEMAWIREQRFSYTLKSYKSDTIQVFEEKEVKQITSISSDIHTLEIKNIHKAITRKSLWKNDFYTFENLKKYLWELRSMDEFISDDRYLGNIKIDFEWSVDRLLQINNEDLLQAISMVLKQLEVQIKEQEIQYEGTKEFKPQPISTIFKKEKDLMVDLNIEPISYDKDWFVFDQIISTSEEENFLSLFHRKVEELKKQYEDIWLLRSERAFALYSFDDWQRFEPDFLLFLRNKKKENITYQVFIEPKWDHLLFIDKWKEAFLVQINTDAKILDFNFWNYKLIWLPFYNKTLENEFEKAMDSIF